MAVQWQKVHVFISSTFNDMHAERDYLVKRVFPELADWCERRKLRLVDVDLRWGVTEADATANANVVRTCLKRIDDCRPFFVCLLGQRYGWAPTADEVSEKTLEEYPHLNDALAAGSSVTEMEILHAIVKPFRDAPTDGSDDDERYQPAEHSFFYLREPGYLDDLPTDPPALRRIYTDEAEEDESKRAGLAVKLRQLHDKTIPLTQRPVRHYRATWDPDAHTPEIGVPVACPALLDANVDRWRHDWEKVLGPGVTVTDRELPAEHEAAAKAYNERLTRGRLTHFQRTDGDEAGEELAATILRDLKAAIAARYPDHVEVEHATGLQRELDQQEQFLFLSSDGFIESGNDLAELDAYVAGDSRQLLVLTAEGGMGKSMLLANWIDRCRRQANRFPNTTFHARFVGQSDGSSSVAGLLRLLLEEMQDVAGRLPRTTIEKQTDPDGREREVEVPFEIPADPRKIPQFWKEQLPRLGERGRTVIVIDALNQLEGGLRDVNWLPLHGLPPGVKLIVSFRSDAEGAAALIERLERNPNVQFDDVAPFEDVADRKQLVARYLEQYLKELDDQHVEQLVQAAGAANPLYLKVVLSELRVFGSFTGLREKIEHDFGPTPVTAFGALLRRLEGDPSYTAVDPKTAVPVLFGLLLHARRGLSAGELTELFVDQLKLQEQRREDVAEAVQVLLRQAVAFLGRRDGLFDYFFESFELATRDRYVVGGDGAADSAREAKDWHGDLARYFAEQPLYLTAEAGQIANFRKLDELAYQQTAADAWDDLRGTLSNFDFLHAKLKGLGYQPLIEDYDTAIAGGYREFDLDLVRNALQLAATALQDDDRQLPSQLAGRLLESENPSVSELVAQAEAVSRWTWLRSVRPALVQAGGPLTFVLAGHRGLVTAVAVTRDWRRVISGGNDGTVRIWDATSGDAVFVLAGHTDEVRGVVAGRSGHIAVSCSMDMTVRVWDIMNGSELRAFRGHTESVEAVAVMPNGHQIVSVSADGTARLWNYDTGVEEQVIDSETVEFRDVQLSPDGRRAVWWSADSHRSDMVVRVWDLATSRKLATLHQDYPRFVVVSPDVRWMVTGAPEEAMTLWDLADGERKRTLGRSSGRRMSIASSDDTQWLLTASENAAHVWDLVSGDLVCELKRDIGLATAVLMCDGEIRLVSMKDGDMHVWNPESGHLVHSLPGLLSYLGAGAVRIAPNGRRVVSCGGDAIRIWSLRPGSTETSHERARERAKRILSSLDERRVVLEAGDGGLQVWDCLEGALLHTIQGRGVHHGLLPDGRRVVSCDHATLRVWDIDSGEDIRAMKGDGVLTRHSISAVAACPDGRRAVAGSEDGSVRIWDLSTGEEAQVLSGPIGVGSGGIGYDSRGQRIPSYSYPNRVWRIEITPDGSRAISASGDNMLRVWDLESGEAVHVLAGHTGPVMRLALCPAGRLAVSSSSDGTVRAWDMHIGRELYVLYCNRGGDAFSDLSKAPSIAISPDGQILVTGSSDGTCQAWHLATGTLCFGLAGRVASTPDQIMISPDARFAAAISHLSYSITTWDLSTGHELAALRLDYEPTCIYIGLKQLIVVDGSGEVHLLQLRGVESGPVVVTAARLREQRDAESRQIGGELEVRCTNCRSVLAVSAKDLGDTSLCSCCGARMRLNRFLVHEYSSHNRGARERLNRWIVRRLRLQRQ